MKPDFDTVTEFENKVAQFFGSPYAVAVDSCTHGIELCLIHTKAKEMYCPKHTYLSIPFLATKLRIKLHWVDYEWWDFYSVTSNIFDAAVYWKENGYVPGTFMCISFQYQKHLSLGKGGMILLDNSEDAVQLKKMSYDGRLPKIPWRQQNVDTMGYHYYLTPETAALGISKLQCAIAAKPRQWVMSDWPDLTRMEIFKNTI